MQILTLIKSPEIKRPSPSTTAEAKDDVYAELSKLNNLKKEGALNQTEFNKQRKYFLKNTTEVFSIY